MTISLINKKTIASIAIVVATLGCSVSISDIDKLPTDDTKIDTSDQVIYTSYQVNDKENLAINEKNALLIQKYRDQFNELLAQKGSSEHYTATDKNELNTALHRLTEATIKDAWERVAQAVKKNESKKKRPTHNADIRAIKGNVELQIQPLRMYCNHYVYFNCSNDYLDELKLKLDSFNVEITKIITDLNKEY